VPEAPGIGPVRVAVTSSQGRKVDLHFGHADQFLIFELDGIQARYVEMRRIAQEDEPADYGDLDRAVELIADCDVLLTMRAGVHARERLRKRGIRCHEHDGGLLPGLDAVRTGAALFSP
jgi:nitrogen fixation protein NifB